jgi:hypothetical protein
MTRRAARFTEADVKRAVKAVEAIGSSRVVEVLPDGTIRIVPNSGTRKPAVLPSRKMVL